MRATSKVWDKPDVPALADRLIAVVTGLRADIDDGPTRACEDAIEAIDRSLQEMEDSDVPANYIARLRSEQAALRKAALRVYHIQREEFLPTAKAMVTSLVSVIIVMLLFTNMGGPHRVARDRRLPVVLLPLPAAAAEHHRQAVQGRA